METDPIEQREVAMVKRRTRMGAELAEDTKIHTLLKLGQAVLVQNQEGNTPLRWDKTGVVVEVKAYDQNVIKRDGSGNLSLRNRKFLCPHYPFKIIYIEVQQFLKIIMNQWMKTP